jgi:hypothetical protein
MMRSGRSAVQTLNRMMSSYADTQQDDAFWLFSYTDTPQFENVGEV